jgi:SAM-dependent methyltransferase
MQERALSLADFASRDACPACGSGAIAPLSSVGGFSRAEQFPTARVTLGSDVLRSRRLCRCRPCGLWFFNRVPRPEVLQELLDKPDLEARWAAEDRPTFRRGRAVMASLLPGGGALLDVGAHSGGFLDTVGPGWTRAAVEPMAASAQNLEGVRVYGGFLEDVELDPGAYDCITAFDVVEHFSQPLAAVQRVADGLRPGGIFVLETGTVDAWAARMLGAGWYYLNYLEHFQAFSRRSMASLLAQAGLEVVSIEQVVHGETDGAGRGMHFARAAAFALLTGFGRTASVWQWANGKARPSGFASPPSTISLGRDHMFVVARKPGAVSAG